MVMAPNRTPKPRMTVLARNSSNVTNQSAVVDVGSVLGSLPRLGVDSVSTFRALMLIPSLGWKKVE
jgi:hypothetical protein